MPKPKGPPYVDDPECQYVVIGDPWPGGRDSSNRDARYFDKVAFWLFYMLGEQASPDTIYYVKTVRRTYFLCPIWGWYLRGGRCGMEISSYWYN